MPAYITARETADHLDVSANRVHNRIDRLEDTGVIRGYFPQIDYEAANLPLRVLFTITAPPTERSEHVEELLDIEGVIDVGETLTGQRNILVDAVGTDTSDISRITDLIHQSGLEVERSEIMNQRQITTLNYFNSSGDPGDEELGDVGQQ